MKDIERYAAIAAAVEMLEKSGMYFELTIKKVAGDKKKKMKNR